MATDKDQALQDILDNIIENADTGSKELLEDDKYEIADLTKVLKENYYFLKNELDDDGTIKKKTKRQPRVEHMWYG